MNKEEELINGWKTNGYNNSQMQSTWDEMSKEEKSKYDGSKVQSLLDANRDYTQAERDRKVREAEASREAKKAEEARKAEEAKKAKEAKPEELDYFSMTSETYKSNKNTTAEGAISQCIKQGKSAEEAYKLAQTLSGSTTPGAKLSEQLALKYPENFEWDAASGKLGRTFEKKTPAKEVVEAKDEVKDKAKEEPVKEEVKEEPVEEPKKTLTKEEATALKKEIDTAGTYYDEDYMPAEWKEAVDKAIAEGNTKKLKKLNEKGKERYNLKVLYETEIASGGTTEETKQQVKIIKDLNAQIADLEKQLAQAKSDKEKAEIELKINTIKAKLEVANNTLFTTIEDAQKAWDLRQHAEDNIFEHEMPKNLVVSAWRDIKHQNELVKAAELNGTDEELKAAKAERSKIVEGYTYYLFNALGTALLGMSTNGGGNYQPSEWQKKQASDIAAETKRWNDAKDSKFKAVETELAKISNEDTDLRHTLNQITLNSVNKDMLLDMSEYEAVRSVYLTNRLGQALGSGSVDQSALARAIMYKSPNDFIKVLSTVPQSAVQECLNGLSAAMESLPPEFREAAKPFFDIAGSFFNVKLKYPEKADIIVAESESEFGGEETEGEKDVKTDNSYVNQFNKLLPDAGFQEFVYGEDALNKTKGKQNKKILTEENNKIAKELKDCKKGYEKALKDLEKAKKSGNKDDIKKYTEEVTTWKQKHQDAARRGKELYDLVNSDILGTAFKKLTGQSTMIGSDFPYIDLKGNIDVDYTIK